MNTVKITTSIPTATSIEHEYHLLGFTKGAPPHVPAEFVQADIRIYARLKCPCGHRGHKVQPWHRGREYRLLATCRKCAAGVQC